MSVTSAGRARATVRPGPASTDAERVARLEHYVERIDEDLRSLWHALDQQADEVIAEARRRDDELRQEIEAHDAERRSALRSSMRRQRWGAICVLVGLVLATLGNVL